MHLPFFFVGFLTLAGPVAETRQSLGIFSAWGAFRQMPSVRCFAMAEPTRSLRPEGWRPFVAITYGPQTRAAGQVYFKLSRQKRVGSAILLRIDDRTFQLAGGGVNAWAPNSAADLQIVRAMRTGVHMTIETRSVRGVRVREYYQLRGAATAIDAAAIGCKAR